MSDLGGASFVLLFLGFFACMVGSGLAGVVAWALGRRGKDAAARTAAVWSGGLGAAAAACLFLAGAVFVWLSQ